MSSISGGAGVKRLRWIACAGCVVFGCMGWAESLFADVYVRDDIIVNPVPALFSVCHGRGCDTVSTVSLSTGQWQAIARVFSVAAADPQQERQQIGEAIATFETIVGKLTGTSGDKPENEFDWNYRSQMDCIDESINTSSYLKMLIGGGFLKWHLLEDRATRGWFLFGWPHTSAVVRDLQSNQRWVVDSWFFANGERPVIIPLAQWKAGWRPPKP